MRATQHISNNRVLGAPPGVPIDECTALAVTLTEYDDGAIGRRSFWRPSPQELQRLNAGGLVFCEVLGAIHPPLLLGVDGVAP